MGIREREREREEGKELWGWSVEIAELGLGLLVYRAVDFRVRCCGWKGGVVVVGKEGRTRKRLRSGIEIERVIV